MILTEDELDQHFGDQPRNLGILNGMPSHGHVDLDLDCPGALVLTPILPPETRSRFGRVNRPASHWLYQSDPPPATTKFADVDGKALIELRSTGSQMIFPPSVHTSGERITWMEDGEPTRIDADLLLAHSAHLAAACCLARHWPEQGSRNNAALALAGGLITDGWRVATAQTFIEEVATAAGDLEAGDRGKAAASTADKVNDGQNVTGWTRLKHYVGDEVVAKVQAWLRAYVRAVVRRVLPRCEVVIEGELVRALDPLD